MSNYFSSDELRVLREHGIVLFADRVIINAQPPMPQARIAEVQSVCAGPLPQPLLDLWQLTAGGELAYDLRAQMAGNDEALSWAELFFDGSDQYRDLQGWIEHEQEIAEEASTEDGQVWDGKLQFLPIGGFEYCDRIYVALRPECHGRIVAWKRGLPGWAHTLQQDEIATIGADLDAAFAALSLDVDPELSQDGEGTGVRVLEYLDERVEQHGMTQELADKLALFYRRAVLDWRTPLAQGRLTDTPRLARLALQHAVDHDDAALVSQLAAQGMAFNQPLGGSASPVDVALMRNAFAATEALLQAGAPVGATAIHHINQAPTAALVARLLAGGAVADALGVARCVACGAPEAARQIAQACGENIGLEYLAVRDAMLARYLEDLGKVRKGKLGHYLGEGGLVERVNHLQAFVL